MIGQIQTAGPASAPAPAPAPATVRYAPPLGDSPETYVARGPDRRWARILRALRERPMTTGDLHRAVGRPGLTPRQRRKDAFRTRRSISGLIRCGLAVHTGQGLIATPEGLDILTRAERAAGWPIQTTPQTEGTPTHD